MVTVYVKTHNLNGARSDEDHIRYGEVIIHQWGKGFKYGTETENAEFVILPFGP